MPGTSAKTQYNPAMPKKPFINNLLESAGFFTLLAVGVMGVLSLETAASRWIAIGLLLAFTAVEIFVRDRFPMVFAPIQLVVILGLLALSVETSFSTFILLFFILSADVVMVLPIRTALMWIAVFSGVVMVVFGLTLGWQALGYALPICGGLFFFGAFGNALKQTEIEKARSDQLLSELRAAQEQLRALTIAEERNRLARELHDSLGHRLTVAVVQLEGAQRLIEKDPARAGRMIGAMREQMKEALAELRRSVATLRAPLADDLPLETALTNLAREFQESTGLTVHLALPAALPPLTEAQRLAVYRAAQESLTNTQKHAQARNIWLTLAAADGRLTLQASDDGQGLTGAPTEGFGLRGLHERAAQVGGQLALAARPGGGTQLTFSLPLSLAEGQAA